MTELTRIDSDTLIKRSQLNFVVLLIFSSFLVFSCRSKSHQTFKNERKYLSEYFGSPDEIKYVFGFPIVFNFGYEWRCLVVTREGTCYDMIAERRWDQISESDTDKENFLYLKNYLDGPLKCGKMINDSTIVFSTNLFGEIEAVIDHKSELEGKGIEIDFALYKDNDANRWSMTCTSWSVKKTDSLYTKNEYLYPSEAVLKYFPHKTGHLYIPDSLGEVDAIRITPGLMGGQYEFLLDLPKLSSLPNVRDKRNNPYQRVNQIKILHNASNKKQQTLTARITTEGLVVLNKEDDLTKLVLRELYPASNASNAPVIRFGRRSEYDLPTIIR